MTTYLPVVAILVPLAGAGCVAWWSTRAAPGDPLPPLHLGFLLVALLAVAIGGAGSTAILDVGYWGGAFPTVQSLRLALDHLSFLFALLFLVGLAGASALEARAAPDERRESPVLVLFVGGAGLAVLVAANLPALCLAWAMLDVGLAWVEAHGASRSTGVAAGRSLLLRAASLACVVGAAALLLGRHGSLVLPLLLLTGWPLYLLMAAAVLRLVAYPLPGSLDRTWSGHLVSVVVGGYLWLRIASLAGGRFPVGSWVVVPAALALAVTALLAGARWREPRASSYLAAHWVALIVLAPLLDWSLGRSIALAGVASAALGVVGWMANALLAPQRPAAGGAGRMVLLAAAGGLPLTPGFIARWALLRLLWTQGQGALFVLATVSFVLTSWPAVRRLVRLVSEARDAGEGLLPRGRQDVVAMVATAVPALLLVAGGVAPDVVMRAGSRLVGHASLPPLWGTLWDGGTPAAAVAALVPLVVGLGTYRAQDAALGALARDPVALQTRLELDWLYSRVERAAGWLQHALERGVGLIEGPIALGWIVVWTAVVALYLVGGA